ncbi:TetR/AcrR family transcriptional regulator [Glycomyces scopariae]|uniref:Transcriptional regulator, TetR family n=1 Tax=Glycomyces sambucus TaxID=380244 RepID=A0A1G9M4W7_9ACTN|nr:TetR/AcrR family transcriptional regulator [Glycomyces sambucus]SDL68981.1 transcriptional regulator, TetR family [Glycomyces sambucus]
MAQDRPLRADAARNRARILEAANRQIMSRGPEAPMEAIAEDAGVAVGTLYRHFPTKQDLVRAILEARFDYMTAEAEAAAERVAAGARALTEFTAFARLILEGAADDLAVKTAARGLGTEPDYARHLVRVNAALERVIAAGIADGDLRPDLTVTDAHLFFTAAPIDEPAPARDRWFALMIDAFRAGAARPVG